jgi:hypothetical protein
MVARRLLSRLREASQASARIAAVTPQDAVATMGTTPVNAQPAPAAGQAALLFQLVDALGVRFRHERSFRMSAGALLANRVLLSLDPRKLGAEAPARVLGICDALGLPGALRAEAARQLMEARGVHFGFEGEGGRALYKAYFERRDANVKGKSPVLLHVAFKWDAEDASRHVVTRYHWYPDLSAAQLKARMKKICGDTPVLEAGAALLALAAKRVPAEELQYLEVREQGSERLSFDLNVYDAGLALRDAQPLLAKLRQHFALRPGEYQALYDQVRARPLGHFAGGVHRDGKAFATVYYGVEARG